MKGSQRSATPGLHSPTRNPQPPRANSQSPTPTTPSAIISVRGLTVGFGAEPVLQGLDLDVARGATVVILGESGCGKTVLLKCLIGLLRPEKGQVLYKGQDICSLDERDLSVLRKEFGMLFQGAALFDSLTVAENIAFPLRQHTRLTDAEVDRVVAEKLELVGLPGTQDKMPAALSGGMRKRVGLARAIAMDPEVILYDEPTTGLDPIMADQINDLIIKMQEALSVTSFVVTHDISSAAKVGDRLLRMYGGRFIFDGTAGDIMASTDPLVRSFVRGDSRMMEKAVEGRRS